MAILLILGLGFFYLRKKRMAGSQSPVALTAIGLNPTKEKDLEARKSFECGTTGSCSPLDEPTPTSEESGALVVPAVPKVEEI